MENKEKLKVLINHLVGHNEEHAQEILDMAKTALELGNQEAHDLLVKGGEELRGSNDALNKALELL